MILYIMKRRDCDVIDMVSEMHHLSEGEKMA